MAVARPLSFSLPDLQCLASSAAVPRSILSSNCNDSIATLEE